MRIELLDINRYIRDNNIKEVKNSRLPTAKGFEPESLWDENIFGKVGSRDRTQRFGYINLKFKFINPILYNSLKVSCEEISRIIYKKKKYIIKNKKYEESEEGDTGLVFLINTLDKVDLNKLTYESTKDELISFFQTNKELSLIDKQIVLPAFIRDIDYKSADRISSSEINDKYKELLFSISSLTGDDEIDSHVKESVQRKINDIYNWLVSNIGGKQGIFRGSILRKTLDYSARVILTADPSIKLGTIGISWNVMVLLYEPLMTYGIFNTNQTLKKEIENSLEKHVNQNDLMKFFQNVNKYPYSISQDIKDMIIEELENISKSAVVMVKRDPPFDRNAWFSAHPIPIPEDNISKLSHYDTTVIGGDCDGDTVQILPLFTEKAKATADKLMNPLNAPSKWKSINTNYGQIYNLTLDVVSTIYRATSETKPSR
jgi:DNA-directed RNA polymerase beta' subunit